MDIFYVWDKNNPLVEVEHSSDGVRFDWLIETPYYKDKLEEVVTKFLADGGHYDGTDEEGEPVIATLSTFEWAGRNYELEYQIPMDDSKWPDLLKNVEAKDAVRDHQSE